MFTTDIILTEFEKQSPAWQLLSSALNAWEGGGGSVIWVTHESIAILATPSGMFFLHDCLLSHRSAVKRCTIFHTNNRFHCHWPLPPFRPRFHDCWNRRPYKECSGRRYFLTRQRTHTLPIIWGTSSKCSLTRHLQKLPSEFPTGQSARTPIGLVMQETTPSLKT